MNADTPFCPACGWHPRKNPGCIRIVTCGRKQCGYEAENGLPSVRDMFAGTKHTNDPTWNEVNLSLVANIIAQVLRSEE